MSDEKSNITPIALAAVIGLGGGHVGTKSLTETEADTTTIQQCQPFIKLERRLCQLECNQDKQ